MGVHLEEEDLYQVASPWARGWSWPSGSTDTWCELVASAFYLQPALEEEGRNLLHTLSSSGGSGVRKALSGRAARGTLAGICKSRTAHEGQVRRTGRPLPASLASVRPGPPLSLHSEQEEAVLNSKEALLQWLQTLPSPDFSLFPHFSPLSS